MVLPVHKNLVLWRVVSVFTAEKHSMEILNALQAFYAIISTERRKPAG